MIIKLQKKFSEQNIDKFISEIYTAFSTNPDEQFVFDFTEVEYISNQELLVFSALLKVFVNSGVKFRVEFFKRATPISQINLRVKKQIIQMWYVWKIFEIVPVGNIIEYFGIDGNSVERLIKELDYVPKDLELYTRYGVTPFIPLKYINNYRESDVKDIIAPLYNLNNIIKELLYNAKCSHPFTSMALNSIITEELYLNFLDHSQRSSFAGLDNIAAMSISFRNKMDERGNKLGDIQVMKKLNFSAENLQESINFFYDSEAKRFKNFPYIEFSFLDFGEGISKTLRPGYELSKDGEVSSITDTEVLRYAFRHDSSRHSSASPENENKLIPRGLYDVLVLVKRYRGLIVARSNNGRLIYDFSDGSTATDGVEFLKSSRYFFPGTLISIYIPAVEDITKLNLSTIKPEIEFPANVRVSGKYKYISFADIYDKLNYAKPELYNSLFRELRSKLPVREKPSLVFFDFLTTHHVEKRILRKVLYFLVSDYEVNRMNNVVIINFFHTDLLKEVSDELMELSTEIKNYKIHPLPVTSFNPTIGELNVVWLGIFDVEDRKKLEQLLYDEYSLAKSDFRDPQNIAGHIINFDAYGNLISNFPSSTELVKIYRRQQIHMYSLEVQRLIDKHSCIWEGGEDKIFLCSGNYYQRQYIEVTDLLNDRTDSQIVSRLLFDLVANACGNIEDYHFIGITSTSQKLFKALELQNIIAREKYIVFDSYHVLEKDGEMDQIERGKKYILICDVIATGSLTQRLYDKLKENGAELAIVGVLVDTRTDEGGLSNTLMNSFPGKIKSLFRRGISKYMKTHISDELAIKRIIRINPFTNIPITLSIDKTYYRDSVIFPSNISFTEVDQKIVVDNEFLFEANEQDINVGYLKFNSLVHPYFFDTDKIFSSIGEGHLKKLFERIGRPNLATDAIKIFYPRKSGIEHFDINLLKSALGNHDVEQVELERFSTSEGWRFPHNSNYTVNHVNNKICFILDDGSCSGDSLMQMVDEIAFYNVREILVLCFVGRVGDHKREFFSRLSTLKVNGVTSVDISIYFVSHWHLPTYYLDENPNINERHWLNEVISFPNAPLALKRIAKNVLGQIIPQEKKDFKDYKYLPKEKNSDGTKAPKKALLVVREELGKVIGFRLYSQSFKFFDLFFKKYELLPIAEEHYREMELLCACFIFEPYLYERMKGVLPDIALQIEEFVQKLIFGKTINLDDLTYEWDKTDIIHLFFIVFRNQPMITLLSKENFRDLVHFTYPKHSGINYILYKLLYYFPINAEELSTKNLDLRLKELMLELSNDDSIPKKEIKKFYTFIASLPARGDFGSQLAMLKDRYIQQDRPELHESKISLNHNISLFIANVRNFVVELETDGTVDEKDWIENREIWFQISQFVAPILSFSKTFSGFLKPYPYFLKLKNIEEGEGSLREMMGNINEVVFLPSENIKEKEKLEGLERDITRVQLRIEVNSDFHKLIKENKTSLNVFIEDLKSRLKENGKTVDFEEDELFGAEMFNIPMQYTDVLLTQELVNNIKNHSASDQDAVVVIRLAVQSGKVQLLIRNKISVTSFDKSNGEGLKCLYLLAEFGPFGFSYHSETQGSDFIQILTFKAI